MREQLKEQMVKIGISLSDKQVDQFLLYYDMLVKTNRVMNLTAITEWEEVLTKHFVDSLAVAGYVEFKKGQKLIDVGTGAGFPGIPLKIVFPDLNVTLMDSLNKRIGFLQDVIQSLGLAGIEAIHSRAEELGRNKKYREAFDVCVSRAVANLSVLSEYCTPFLKRGGTFVSYKAGNCDEECSQAKNAIMLLGCELIRTEKIVLPETDIQRTFLFIQRTKPLSGKYPRKAGTPSKEPLS